jgi:tetratricopeptide (TPR) repeat protein
MNLLVGLQEANVYFDQVIERVPTFAEVYLDRSDLYAHALGEDSAGVNQGILTEEELANAYPAVIADYKAAAKHSTSSAQKVMFEMDLAYMSGAWRGLNRRIENALAQPGCVSSNWLQVIADIFGYSEQYLEQARSQLTCDPRRSLSWFNVARTTLRTGDAEEALRIAREGTEVAPGAWLSTTLVRALIVNGKYDEALAEINKRIDDVDLALAFKALVAAAQGNQELFDELFKEFKVVNTQGWEWIIIVGAWGGHRDEVNAAAGMVDQHDLGSVTLSVLSQWCACGSPFDLEATPNFAAKLKESGLTWPPPPVMDYPLKDW